MQELFSGATSFDAVLLLPRLAVTMLLMTLMCGAVKCCSVERCHCLKMKLLLASALRALGFIEARLPEAPERWPHAARCMD